ncbi:MAG: ComEC/Rec2 family competence protein [Exiguobacterium sp.]|nr:ComEC/Rec2 family competence protein [Exiguobacterium sp.]
MPLFPLFAVLIVTGLTEGVYLVSVVASVFYLVTRRGQGLYAKAGVIGLICIASFHTPPTESLPSDTIAFSIESRKENGKSVRLYGNVDNLQGVLRGRELNRGRPGETCLVQIEVEAFQPLRNTGGFDERAWALSSNVSFKGKVKRIDTCRPTAGWDGRMLRWKERKLQQIEHRHRADVALYMEALLFGESRMLDEQTSFSYRVTGLLHLLVISGSHIAMLIVAMRILMQPIPIRRETKTVLMIFSITMFGWMTGFSPPVARAVIVADTILFLSFRCDDSRPDSALELVCSGHVGRSTVPSHESGFPVDGRDDLLFVSHETSLERTNRVVRFRTAVWADCTMASTTGSIRGGTDMESRDGYLYLMDHHATRICHMDDPFDCPVAYVCLGRDSWNVHSPR